MQEEKNTPLQLSSEKVSKGTRMKQPQPSAEPKAKPTAEATAKTTEALAPIVRQRLPKEVHIMRTFVNNYSQIEGEFFSKVPDRTKRSFTESDFSSLLIAVGQKLYEDSFSTARKNEKGKELNIGRALSEKNGVYVDITLKYIIEEGYGVEATNEKHRQEIIELIKALNNTPLVSLDTKGTGEFIMLLNLVGGRIEKYKTHRLRLRVDRVLYDTALGHAKYPRGTMRRLVADAGSGKSLAIDKRLLLHLANQDRAKPHTDKIEDLAQMFGRWEEYKHNRQRFIANFIKTLLRFIRVGIIAGYEIYENGSITFFFKESQIEDKKQ